MEDMNADDLIKAWQYQDQFEGISMNLIEAGIQLGVRSTGVEMLKLLLQSGIFTLKEEQIKKAMDDSYDLAVKQLREKMKNARGA